MTFHHYLEQPMSMIQLKKIRRLFERKDGVKDFEYKWLPDSLRITSVIIHIKGTLNQIT